MYKSKIFLDLINFSCLVFWAENVLITPNQNLSMCLFFLQAIYNLEYRQLWILSIFHVWFFRVWNIPIHLNWILLTVSNFIKKETPTQVFTAPPRLFAYSKTILHIFSGWVLSRDNCRWGIRVSLIFRPHISTHWSKIRNELKQKL